MSSQTQVITIPWNDQLITDEALAAAIAGDESMLWPQVEAAKSDLSFDPGFEVFILKAQQEGASQTLLAALRETLSLYRQLRVPRRRI